MVSPQPRPIQLLYGHVLWFARRDRTEPGTWRKKRQFTTIADNEKFDCRRRARTFISPTNVRQLDSNLQNEIERKEMCDSSAPCTANEVFWLANKKIRAVSRTTYIDTQISHQNFLTKGRTEILKNVREPLHLLRNGQSGPENHLWSKHHVEPQKPRSDKKLRHVKERTTQNFSESCPNGTNGGTSRAYALENIM